MTKLDPLATRYLLGEMLDAEQAAFESAFLCDDELHQRVRATEDDLLAFLDDVGGVQRLAVARARRRRVDAVRAHPEEAADHEVG